MKYAVIKPIITEEDKYAVKMALDQGDINDGEYVEELEKQIGEYHNCKCVILSNCTLALELIINYATKIYTQTKDIYCTDVSMISTINALIQNTDFPINLLPVDERNLIFTKDYPPCFYNSKEKLYVLTDFNGRIALDIGKNCYHNTIIIDSAQSILTKSIEYNDYFASAFSLNAVKNITAGIGGGVLTRNNDLYEWLKRIKNYGRDIGKGDSSIDIIGSNYKMSNINAALALSQWQRKDSIIKDKWRVYDTYRSILYSNMAKDIIVHNEPNEVPWLVEVKVNEKYYNNNPFRSVYTPYSKMEHLKAFAKTFSIDNYQYEYHVFLPSWIGITNDEIKHYAKIFLAGFKSCGG